VHHRNARLFACTAVQCLRPSTSATALHATQCHSFHVQTCTSRKTSWQLHVPVQQTWLCPVTRVRNALYFHNRTSNLIMQSCLMGQDVRSTVLCACAVGFTSACIPADCGGTQQHTVRACSTVICHCKHAEVGTIHSQMVKDTVTTKIVLGMGPCLCVAADRGKDAKVACVRLSCVVLDMPRC